MAIVKLQNGNVLLKDGKVSCSCCAPVGCCMYPAQALVDGAYTYEDLPDAIDVAGVVFTKIDPPESVAGFTRYYVNANDEYLGILDGEEEPLWSYEGGGGPCLINGYNGQGGEREDQFADAYTITTPEGSVIVSRQSLCTWEGQNEYGPAGIVYSGASEAKWFAFISLDEPVFGRDGEKQDNQSSPSGTYYNEISVS